ncbi:hypothetical protein [Roseicyclus mahoneyensis]|uniref:Uncharacterized protein n=1 Tax=Roseicyclus mahoneyensis TaxID=164332 RepID=A0A316GJK5_9RHOB|nr:hypothetical protein [Roseicyclus mahoneyensis]PWK61092.1 hypothetical protein C7455_103292 [Roseicyclus mahoneyensis]
MTRPKGRPAGSLQNRVLPTGEIVAEATYRGMFTGNRGILHRADATLGASRWTHPHWVTCTLTHPRGHHHGAMPDRGWTALFFLDEAVALAAGHRPCGYCRRAAYDAWLAAWAQAHGPTDRMIMDRRLHGARVTRNRAQFRHQAEAQALPDGVFVLWRDRPHLLVGAQALPFDVNGYGPAQPRPPGPVTILTPRPTVAVLAAGYKADIHPSAADDGV